MPNYVILANRTDQATKSVKDSVRADEGFETAIEKAGRKSIGLYYRLGKHDVVAIVGAPNQEAIASILCRTGSLGNVRTETIKASSMSEAADIIEKIS